MDDIFQMDLIFQQQKILADIINANTAMALKAAERATLDVIERQCAVHPEKLNSEAQATTGAALRVFDEN